MSCDVHTYDTSYVALKSKTVQLIAIDTSSSGAPINLTAVVINGPPLGGTYYGAQLSFGLTSCVYQVAITDSARIYAGVTIPSLNGNVDGELEVVLRRLPPKTPAGAVVRTSTQLIAYLADQPWSFEQRSAVLDVVHALVSIRGWEDPIAREFIANYEQTLRERGVDPAIF